MVDLQVLEAYGLDPVSLRKKFELPANGTTDAYKDENIKMLVERIRSRIQGARDFNISNYQHYYALDLAWDMPLKQITPTMLTTLIDKDPDDATVMDSLRSWGLDLNQVIEEVPDPKTPGKSIKKINVPAFFQVYVPLVKAYVTVRWAKIMNDRRLVPFFKYEPTISNPLSRMRCEVITARVEAVCRQMGYYDVLKQAVFRMLHYGECLLFPVEEWFKELQEIESASEIKGQNEKTVNGLKVKTAIVKEGVRYHLPHPTRSYFDRSFFPSTFNTDTGCSHGGYWQVVKWKDVISNPAFYNKEAVGFSDFAGWFNATDRSYWVNVLRGCAVDFPGTEVANSGVSKDDTEKHLTKWYSRDMTDKPIVVTQHFEKLVPKEWNLGDYEHAVWFRFFIAADSTIMYCAPVAYCPILYMAYDAAEGRTRNISMSLEVLPFQDHFSNLLTQYLITVKQNLSNLTLIDTDILDQKEVDRIQNWGERFWRKINIFGKSMKQITQKLGSNPASTVQTFRFPTMPTAELVQAMRTVLDTLERVLVMSAQEVGQAATHEQTREEVKNIQSNTSTRVVFTGTAVDITRDAWKRQLYEALMAYGSDEFYAEVPMDEPLDAAKLEKLGFTFDPDQDFDERRKRARVKANKTAISSISFTSDRDGDDRINDAETAAAMTGFLERMINNQMTAQAIGPEQAIDIANAIARFAGFPRDFKLKNIGPNLTPEQQNKEIMQQVAQMLQEAIGGLSDEVKQGFAQIVQENHNQDVALAKMAQEVQKLEQTLQEAQTLHPPNPNETDGVPGAPGLISAAI